MKEPILTDQAKDDLREVWYSIASKRDERTADRLVTQILDKCRSHAQFRERTTQERRSTGSSELSSTAYVVFQAGRRHLVFFVPMVTATERIMREE